ncbi:MAG TPA: DUF4363 family protein [Clostridia bacterium]|nr:DUF4363 family protein [Clostridia bacterium]
MLVVLIRTLILFFLVVFVMRMMGKRQIGQLQPFELVVAIMVSELATIPMQNTGVPLAYGVLSIFLVLIAQISISFFSMRSVKFRNLICGKPRTLVKQGKFVEEAFDKEMYTINDLMEQLRIKDIVSITGVNYAVIETNGDISIIPTDPGTGTGTTPPPPPAEPMYSIIIDGIIIKENLSKANISEEWLKKELKKGGINDASEVFFCECSPTRKINYQKMNTSRRKKMLTTKIFIAMMIFLVVIVAGLFFLKIDLDRFSQGLENDLNSITLNIMDEKWEAVNDEFKDLQNAWEEKKTLWMIVQDHIEIDNIEFSMAKLSKTIESQDKTESLIEAANLMKCVSHIPDKESINFRNIF